jgi:hypothetical protein
MAKENQDWGYFRIRSALLNSGDELARSTIASILKRNAIEPAPDRVQDYMERVSKSPGHRQCAHCF